MHGSDRILTKDNVVARRRIMDILSYRSWAIIVQQNSFAVFFIGTHSSHVDSIIVVAEIAVVVCRPIDRRLLDLLFLPDSHFLKNLGAGWR